MIDIFLQKDLHALLKHKNLVFMGDSNIRALYKDFLCLVQQPTMIPKSKLKAKMETSVFKDKLVFHGKKHNGRDYREEREFNGCKIQASFYFITRVYDDYVKTVLNMITKGRDPDVLIINSCLWDVTRWGASGVEEYKTNLNLLMKHLRDLLPNCLVIWLTTPPISSEVRGGFLVPDLQFLQYSLRFHVVEANHFARQVVVEHGFDVVDIHYHLKSQIHRRERDGIHWMPEPVRYVLNLLLTHISLAWNVPLPHRYNSLIMKEYLERLEDELSMPEPMQEKVQAPQSRQKVNKENRHTPKKSKKQQPRGKPFRGESHHTYSNRTRQKERRARVRQWQASAPSTCTSNSEYNSPSVSQHDSGYFPSPSTESYSSNPSTTEACLSNNSFHGQLNIALSSPQFTQNSSYNHLGSGSEVPQWQVETETYYPATIQSLPNSSYSYSSGYHYGNGLLEVPYSFPHVTQDQVLRPSIDFTSDDFSAFSV